MYKLLGREFSTLSKAADHAYEKATEDSTHHKEIANFAAKTWPEAKQDERANLALALSRMRFTPESLEHAMSFLSRHYIHGDNTIAGERLRNLIQDIAGDHKQTHTTLPIASRLFQESTPAAKYFFLQIVKNAAKDEKTASQAFDFVKTHFAKTSITLAKENAWVLEDALKHPSVAPDILDWLDKQLPNLNEKIKDRYKLLVVEAYAQHSDKVRQIAQRHGFEEELPPNTRERMREKGVSNN